MGGQACVLYGGAEFSRDTDLAVLADPENLSRLDRALAELTAERVAVPPFERAYLDMGLAVHFRCHHPEAEGLRIDVMSRMRGVDPFPALWERRTTLEVGDESVEVLSLPDLVRAKKTQRDKDWPMIARLVEANYFANRDRPSAAQLDFWLREMRTPALLVELARRVPVDAERMTPERALLSLAVTGDEAGLQTALTEEEEQERAADRAYWAPLKKELERLRHARDRRDRPGS
jgi:hypothetical protein